MQEDENIQYQRTEPGKPLQDYIKCFWTLHNAGSEEKKFTILPDGHFDLVFRSRDQQDFFPSLTGLATKEFECVVPANATFMAISFKLPAVDYVFETKLASLLDNITELPHGFWEMKQESLSALNHFCKAASKIILMILSGKNPDPRLLHLSRLLYDTQGALRIEEMAQQVYWSSRQINRWFNNRFGLSLKAYCNILRYRASFDQLKDEKLYPEQNYTDQSHFIKEVKKYSGVTPGKIAKNKNDRFIQLSTLRRS